MITCLTGITANATASLFALISGLTCGSYTLHHMDSSDHATFTAWCAGLTYPLIFGGGLAALIGAGMWIG